MRSDEVRVGAELPERADVLVSEVLDSNVLGEGVLSSFEDAHARLIKPGAAIVPRAASAMIALVGGEQLARTVSVVGECAGFDLSAFNEFTPERVIFDGTRVDFERLADPVEGVRFDFRESHHPPRERTLEIPITRSGVCLGVVQWLRIELDDAASYENRPERWEDNPGNWLHSFHPFVHCVRVEAGRTLRLVAGFGARSLYFRAVAAQR
jgi:type II protein arginine methyltransferase